jgi:excisionase family DNA binding protein
MAAKETDLLRVATVSPCRKESAPLTQLSGIPAAAQQLDVTTKGLRGMLARRVLPSVKVGRLRKVPLAAIEEFIAKNTTPALDE